MKSHKSKAITLGRLNITRRRFVSCIQALKAEGILDEMEKVTTT
jgi:hypothetical protein